VVTDLQIFLFKGVGGWDCLMQNNVQNLYAAFGLMMVTLELLEQVM
jgi:hypothetical protein